MNSNKESLSGVEYLNYVERIRKKLDEAPLCNCMYPQCNDIPIQSHVFQRRGVLKDISTKGKVMGFHYNTLFSTINNEQSICYKEVGIYKSFKFWGFCQHHDNLIFKPIEPLNGIVNWYDKKNQYLLAYKTLCRELYIQLQMKKLFEKLLSTFHYTSEFQERYIQSLANISYSIRVFERYKRLFEESMENNDYSKYGFKVLCFPFRLELCLASPICIQDENNMQNWNDVESKIINPINIVEIFPDKDKTYIIIGFIEGADNIWAREKYTMLSDNVEEMSLALQDILFRSEFHCMSKKLYDEIQDEIPLFLEEWKSLINDYSHKLIYKSNIFRKYIEKQYDNI